MDRTVAHVDLDNFFASVECLYRPEIRDKPVVVGGNEEARHGIVLAKNYPAKKYGIKTAETLWSARTKCPDLIVVPPHHDRYLKFSRLAREVYEDYTNCIMPFGIDENWLDLTGSIQLFGDGQTIAQKIRKRIYKELGITVSVGISYNNIFAKLGSDLAKPNGISHITRENYRDKVWPLPVGDLLYVGPATQKKLHRYGVTTIGRLAQMDPDILHHWLGKCGTMLWTFANGEDRSPVTHKEHESMIKSVGNSTTTPRDLICNEDVRVIMTVLADSVAMRLRDHGLCCQTVQIHVRNTELNVYEKQMKLEASTCLSGELLEAGMKLFCQFYRWDKPIRSIGIRGCDLSPYAEQFQLSLFKDEVKRNNLVQLERTMDDLRRRFGHSCIGRGNLLANRDLCGGMNPREKHVIHPVAYLS